MAPVATHSDTIAKAAVRDAATQNARGRRHERWFDLCFRLIIVMLAGLWLLMPPAASETVSMLIKAADAKP